MFTADINETKYSPLYALLLYQISCSGDNDNAIIATKHPLTLTRGRPTIEDGQLFCEDDLATLTNLMANKETLCTLLPANVLAHSSQHLCWYVKSQKKTMWFTEATGIASCKIMINWPNLILTVCRDELFISAYCGSRRPSSKTKLYHAPLMNVFDNCSLCMGDSIPPKENPIACMDEWEEAVFNTRFSHINDETPLSKSIVQSDVTYEAFIKSMSTNDSEFIASMLKPLSMNLQEHIECILSK